MEAAPYFLQVDALYFQANENGVHYALKDDRVLNPDFKYRFGARGTLGLALPCSCWQLVLQFTHYHGRNRQNHSGAQFFPTWTHPGLAPFGFVDSIYNMWRLHLGLGDVLATRYFEICGCLELWPYFGLRYSEIRHKLRIYYQGGNLFPEVTDFVSMKNKFWGLGPIGGLEGLWRLNSWLGIYARGAGSLPYGKFYIHQSEGLFDQEHDLVYFDEYHQLCFIVEAALGLDLRYCSFYGRIGWDVYLFLDQNQFARFISQEIPGKFIANQGDLSLHGLSLALGVFF
jgi:hypothetical protein